MHNGLTDAQVEQLLKGVNIDRVLTRKEGGRTYSYLAQHDVRAMLIRIFGFLGYSFEVQKVETLYESQVSEGRWSVGVRATGRLAINGSWFGAHWDDVAVGDSENQPSRANAHDQAAKAAVSDLLKRCAVNLGDQFGLSLYYDEAPGKRGGRTSPVVQAVLIDSPEQPINATPQQPGEAVIPGPITDHTSPVDDPAT